MTPTPPSPGHASAGAFLALEGPDGGGKTTQAARLVEWLRGRGREVVACREPGGTPLGEAIRSIVLDRSALAIGMRAEMLLYMASRAQLVEDVIRPALAAGRIVVSDRYLLSTVVYQGYAGGLDPGALWGVGDAATGGLLPDLTMVLDLAPEVARARVGPGRDRIEDRPDDYRRRVRDGFLTAAGSYPGRIAVVDAAADPDAVADSIRREVAHALGLDPRP